MSPNRPQTLIGVDVSKNKLDVHVSASNQHNIVDNNLRAIGSWLTQIKRQFTDAKVVLEPTGGYENTLIAQLLKHEISAFYVHSNHMHRKQRPTKLMRNLFAHMPIPIRMH